MSSSSLPELTAEERKLVSRTPLEIQKSVLFALLMRELRTRFFGYRIGYAWALLEPGLHVTLLSVAANSIKARGTFYDAAAPVFIAMGILPWFMFRRTMSQCLGSFDAGRGLYVYKQVNPLDMLLAHALFNIIIYMIVMVLFMYILYWIGFAIPLDDPISLLMVLGLLCLFTIGFSLVAAVAASRIKEVRKFTQAFIRPLYWVSGVFFSIESIPEDYRIYLLWNPVLHANDLVKGSMIAQYDSPASWLYLLIVTLSILLLGLMLYRQNIRKIMMT